MIEDVLENILTFIEKVGRKLPPFRNLSMVDRFKKARADSRHFRFTSTNLWRYSVTLAIYQLIFGTVLMVRPDVAMGAPGWDPVVAILSPWIQGLVFLLMFITIAFSIPNENKFTIHLTVIVQSAFWIWWSLVFLLEAASGGGTFAGTLTYGLLAAISWVVTKGLMEHGRK